MGSRLGDIPGGPAASRAGRGGGNLEVWKTGGDYCHAMVCTVCLFICFAFKNEFETLY